MNHRSDPARRARLASLVGASAASVVAPLAQPGASTFVNWETPHVSPLALTPSGSLLLAVNTADNRLEVFDASGAALAHLRSIPVGLDPVSVRPRSDTEAWVVNHVSDSISIVDLPTGRVKQTIAVGDEPADVVFAGNPLRAFVTLSQPDQVRVLDPANPTAAGTIIAIEGEDPRALAVDLDGTRVYAAIFESGNHSTVISRIAVSAPSGPYGGQNPPPNDGAEFQPPIAAGLPAPPGVALVVRKDAGGAWRDINDADWSASVTWDLHDHDVAIIDTATLGVTYASGLMTNVASVAVSPAGKVMVVGTELHNEIRFESNVNGIFVRAEAATFVASAPGASSVVDLNPHLDYSTPSVPMAMRDLSIGDPRGVAWNPQGTAAYVTGMGSNNVVVIDSAGGRTGVIDVGQGPTGLAINATGTRLYVLNRFEGSISTVDPLRAQELVRTSFYDPTPAAIREGRPFLYDTHLTSGLGQASCASCHVDARTDHLGWDLGNPAGEVIDFNETCIVPGGCVDWHPMKGVMVTQTLVGTAGNEPFHWRGEKSDLAAFNIAFTTLQGADAQLSPDDMQRLSNFVATLRFPPNPNRNIDNSLKTTLPTAVGFGNPLNGQNIFLNAPTLPGANPTCVSCHALPTGTNNVIDRPIGAEPQNRKIAQLRNVYEKVGASHQSQNNSRGFGLRHDGIEFTIQETLAPGFVFPPGPVGQQQRRDVEAFLLSFDSGTHAGVGVQTTAANGGGAGDNVARITQMFNLAATGAVGLVVKGVQGGLARGWFLDAGLFQSDRSAETILPAALLALAADGSELTYTLVPAGTQVRIGVDRDEDGWFDRDELDAGADPADPTSTPETVCVGDIAPAGGDHVVDGADLAAVLAAWGPCGACAADLAPLGAPDGVVDGADLAMVLSRWGSCR